MAEPRPEEVEGRKHWRKMKRQDTGLELFQQAQANLDDVERLKPILFELSRLYNPLVDGPLVDRPSYVQILEASEAGRVDEARRCLEARLALYVVRDRAPESPGSGAPGGAGAGGCA